jgi:hypothetical protein
MSDFPLPWEHVRLRTRQLAVTDFRLVRLRRGRVSGEIALHDIASITVAPSAITRATSVGTLVLTSARAGDTELRIPRIVNARQAALRLHLLIGDIRGIPPGDGLEHLPMPSIWRVPTAEHLRIVFVGPILLLATAGVVVIGLSGQTIPVAYGPDDPIRPNGVKKSQSDIEAFMEHEVMPFARYALEPIVGKGNVRCETCHGENGRARGWAMPAVAALPEPAVRRVAAAAGSDAQIRNALHGYLAGSDKSRKADRMRGLVMPGMAALLRRPVYDFSHSYEENRARAAFGCYHCHMVEQ